MPNSLTWDLRGHFNFPFRERMHWKAYSSESKSVAIWPTLSANCQMQMVNRLRLNTGWILLLGANTL